MHIYSAPIVKEINSFYEDILNPSATESILHHLEKISVKLYTGLMQKKVCLFTQINNYHPNFLGAPISVLKDIEFKLEDCRHAIANEYGFSTWNDVLALENTHYNMEFEFCVNSLLEGDTEALKNRLEAKPDLITSKSEYGHKATLLHYTASNGVELWRQKVPMNLEQIIILLINAGADKSALMNVYGGEFTSHELFTSSAHPFDSGIDTSISELLKG